MYIHLIALIQSSVTDKTKVAVTLGKVVTRRQSQGASELLIGYVGRNAGHTDMFSL